MTVVGTKAETLSSLSKSISSATVLPSIYFCFQEWIEDRSKIIERINNVTWDANSLVVRSSAVGEDSAHASMAGRFKSFFGPN